MSPCPFLATITITPRAPADDDDDDGDFEQFSHNLYVVDFSPTSDEILVFHQNVFPYI